MSHTQTLLRDKPARWRKRAEEARHAASRSQAVDRFAEKTLLEIADAYDELARLAEVKLTPGKAG